MSILDHNFDGKIISKDGKRYLVVDVTDTDTVLELAFRLNQRIEHLRSTDGWLEDKYIPDKAHKVWNELWNELVLRGEIDDE